MGPNLDLGRLKPFGNYNLAVSGHFCHESKPRPFEVHRQLQFDSERAILDPNLALGLSKPSGDYNLTVKWRI